MKKSNKKSTKGVIVSSVVVLALVGGCVFALTSLAKPAKNDGLKLGTVADLKAAENTNSSKLLSKVDDSDVYYAATDFAAGWDEDIAWEAQPIEAPEEITAAEQDPIEGPDLVVVDNIVDTEEQTEAVLMAAAPAQTPEAPEPETKAPETAPAIELNDSTVEVEAAQPQEEAPVAAAEPESQEPVRSEVVIEITDSQVEEVTAQPEPEVIEVPQEPETQAIIEEEIVEDIPEEPQTEEVIDAVEENTADENIETEEEVPEDDSRNEELPSIDIAGGDVPASATEEPEQEEATDDVSSDDNQEEYTEPQEDSYVEDNYSDNDSSEDYSDDSDNNEEEYVEDNEPEYNEVSYNASLGEQIVNYAASYVGITPYVWAGNSLEEGTDCSGFTHLVFGTFGIYVPRGSDEYQSWGNISYEQLQPGDIVVYRYGGHVGIYAGNDTIIHCSNEITGTIYSGMWYDNPTAYVRVLY